MGGSGELSTVRAAPAHPGGGRLDGVAVLECGVALEAVPVHLVGVLAGTQLLGDRRRHLPVGQHRPLGRDDLQSPGSGVIPGAGDDGGTGGLDVPVVVDEFAAAVGVVGSGGERGQPVPGPGIQRQARPGPALFVGGAGLPPGRCVVPAVFVAGQGVVIGHSDAGGLGGQVVVHQPGGADGSVPDPFGGVDHVRRRVSDRPG